MKKLWALLVPLVLVASCAGGTKRDDSGHNDADVAFAQQMVPHHEQAVEMAALVPDADASPEVTSLAKQISGAQEPEIELMRGWLRDWDADEAHGAPMGRMAMGDGMASDEDLARLATLRRGAFDQLWLQLMTAHHEGAIAMAQTEVDEGKDPDATNLATEIIVAQQAEIETMKGLLG